MIIKTSYPFMKPPPSARLIRGHRLAQGLVGYWLMNENGGLQVFDLSGNGWTGILNTGVDWTAEKFGSALSFNGTADNAVNCGDIATIDNSTELTVSLYCKVDNVTEDHLLAAKLLSFSVGSRGGFLFYFDDASSRTANTDIFVILIYGGGNSNISSYVETTSGFVQANRWYHIVFTSKLGSTTGLKLYVDGILIGVADNSDVDLTHDGRTSNLLFGDLVALADSELRGSISQGIIYNRILSASEIAELYWKPFCMFERKARTALMSGYEVVAPPVGMAGAMTTNTGFWGY